MKQIFILLMLFTLTSCGFHLRGSFTLAPALHKIYIETKNPYGQLTRNLQQYLKQSNVEITASPDTATTVLAILSESETQNLVSVDITQLSRQYNLVLTVTYQVTSAKGEVLVPPQTMTETRSLPIQANQVLAGSNEANTLYQKMREAIVFDIINQLSSAKTTALLKGKNETSISTNKTASSK